MYMSDTTKMLKRLNKTISLQIAVSMPGILGAGMQTIVHTPHGIQTMAPQGPQLTSISQTGAPTTVRPVTIATSSSGGSAGSNPSSGSVSTPTIGPTQKFPTTVIKNPSDTNSFTSSHPLRLGSEVTMVPQNPPGSGGGTGPGGGGGHSGSSITPLLQPAR